jgi:hypothetical protein
MKQKIREGRLSVMHSFCFVLAGCLVVSVALFSVLDLYICILCFLLLFTGGLNIPRIIARDFLRELLTTTEAAALEFQIIFRRKRRFLDEVTEIAYKYLRDEHITQTEVPSFRTGQAAHDGRIAFKSDNNLGRFSLGTLSVESPPDLKAVQTILKAVDGRVSFEDEFVQAQARFVQAWHEYETARSVFPFNIIVTFLYPDAFPSRYRSVQSSTIAVGELSAHGQNEWGIASSAKSMVSMPSGHHHHD